MIELFARAKQADPEAWRRLIQRFGPMVLALARRMGLSPEEQEDLFQRTWLGLVERIDLVRQPEALPAWLASTARRQALAVLRERAVTAESVPEELCELASSDPAELLAEVELQTIVRAELALLPGRCRRLLERLFECSGAPDYQAISQELGMARGSIGPTRQRCLALLAARLERRGLGGGSAPGSSDTAAESIHAGLRDTPSGGLRGRSAECDELP